MGYASSGVEAGIYTYRVVAPQYQAVLGNRTPIHARRPHVHDAKQRSFTAHQDLIAGDTTVDKEGDNVIDFPVLPIGGVMRHQAR